jgi:hypothetical protein
MKYSQNTRILMDWISTVDHPKVRETLGDLGNEIKIVLTEGVPATDTAAICHRLVSAAPAFNGKLFSNMNVASVMRCAAREIRYASNMAT